ncbi:hypothetical protein ASE92_16070 [Pedobacter sp. Leaf41]|uniref:LGFP repeat-containing protein n=1 Tax=Pedobacter sp. Leaf41 TaxID=1736218 RepID=UPI000702CB3C|nr:hypothetical protein [Pedobacter sp. Leaf41]KQN33315.1 hypothetical protein ASE92_16070 [Pedobacter sp. Leaf41]
MSKLSSLKVSVEALKDYKFPKKLETAVISSIESKLKKRFDELGGSKFLGQLLRKDGIAWYGELACVCYNSNTRSVLEIHGAIYQKWVALGGVNWGIPNTDESPCWDGTGRFNHFNGDQATIIWSPQTGAQAIWGDIRRRWADLGWERSYLGYPTSDESNFPDGGRVNSFQRGGIYWWPDTGALDLNDVVLHYTGLVCLRETGETSGADEPYVLMGVVSPFSSAAFRSQTYSSVDSDTSRPDLIEIYRGKPNGLILEITLMENDHGDPEKFRKEIQTAMTAAHGLGTAALGLIPVVGGAIAAVVGPLIQKFIPEVAKAVNNLFGFGDDKIGSERIVLTGKDLILLARRTNNSNYKNVGYKFSTNNLRGHNANYKVYFGIVPA